MKIFLANESKQKFGGGFTFLRNFRKALAGKAELVDSWTECNVYFISGATMVSRDDVRAAKEAGKKIVLRVDNIPKNSRNRNTGTSRLYDFAQMADLVVYQSGWAKDFVGRFIDPEGKKNSAIICNGVDDEIFNLDGEEMEKEGEPQYVYARFNRDETKRWDEAWFFFQNAYFKNPKAHLWIVGNFSQDLIEYNFDFFGGAEKRIRFLGVVEDPAQMARIFRGADNALIPYYNDACSNTLLEALACGCLVDFLKSGNTGGTPELMNLTIEETAIGAMAESYLKEIGKLLAG